MAFPKVNDVSSGRQDDKRGCSKVISECKISSTEDSLTPSLSFVEKFTKDFVDINVMFVVCR